MIPSICSPFRLCCLTLAATLCNARVAEGISGGEAGAFMHGPTFMGNPLACSAAIASIELLLSQPWQRAVQRLSEELEQGLAPARELSQVANVAGYLRGHFSRPPSGSLSSA